MTFSDCYVKLGRSLCLLIFLKRNGEPRCMLATRHLSMASRYRGFFGGEISMIDKRNEKNKGVLAVIDMEIGETRSFNSDRVISLIEITEPETKEEFIEFVSRFHSFKESYLADIWGVDRSTSLDDLDDDTTAEKDTEDLELANRLFGEINIYDI